MAGVVTKHLFDLITKQVEDHKLVVWYDPECAMASHSLPRAQGSSSASDARLGGPVRTARTKFEKSPLSWTPSKPTRKEVPQALPGSSADEVEDQ